jgi:hypothetical protein
MKNQIGNRGNNESTRSSWKYETSRLLKKNVTLSSGLSLLKHANCTIAVT